MNRETLHTAYAFIGLALSQFLVFSNMHLFGYITPFVYPVFLFLLPIKIKPINLMLMAFGLGLTVDLFSNTGGVHASAMVLVAFLRPFILNAILPGGKLDDISKPDIKKLGPVSYMVYTGVLLLIAHLAINFIDVFSLTPFFYTFGKALFSTFLALFFVMIYSNIFSSKS